MSQKGTQNHLTLITKQCDEYFHHKNVPLFDCIVFYRYKSIILISTLNFSGYFEKSASDKLTPLRSV